MGMAAPYTRWTADRRAALPDDGRRYEIIDGELFVTPSPSVRHQRAALALAVRLRAYLMRPIRPARLSSRRPTWSSATTP